MTEVRRSPLHGRGVYATRRLTRGQVATEAPALLLDGDETDDLADHRLAAYLVTWDEHTTAIPFGSLSFVNHSSAPNAELIVDHDRTVVQLVAVTAVAAGDELTVDYGPDHLVEP